MDQILRTGDQAIFMPAFGQAVVVVAPGTLTGSGAPVTVAGMTVCVDGDESSVTVPGCAYVSGNFVTPGTGTLLIDSLGADQLSKKTTVGGKAVMLKGTTFVAKFQVMSPAMQPNPPAPPVPDPAPSYVGQGQFQTTNTTVTDGG